MPALTALAQPPERIERRRVPAIRRRLDDRFADFVERQADVPRRLRELPELVLKLQGCEAGERYHCPLPEFEPRPMPDLAVAVGNSHRIETARKRVLRRCVALRAAVAVQFRHQLAAPLVEGV